MTLSARRIGMAALALSLACMVQSPSYAQDGGGERGERGERGQRGERGGGERGQRGERPDFENMSDEDREAFRARMSEQMQARMQERNASLGEEMGFSEEEFEAISPLMERVQRLNTERQMIAGGGGGRGGFRGGFNTDQMSDPAQAAMEATTALRETLDEATPSKETISRHLTALREARAAHATELAEARAELVEVLTAKQEAILVLSGTLE